MWWLLGSVAAVWWQCCSVAVVLPLDAIDSVTVYRIFLPGVLGCVIVGLVCIVLGCVILLGWFVFCWVDLYFVQLVRILLDEFVFC